METSTTMVLAYELTAYQEIEVQSGLSPKEYRAKAIEQFRNTSESLSEGQVPSNLKIEDDTVFIQRIVSISPRVDLLDDPALASPVSMQEMVGTPLTESPSLSYDAWRLAVRYGETFLGYDDWREQGERALGTARLPAID